MGDVVGLQTSAPFYDLADTLQVPILRAPDGSLVCGDEVKIDIPGLKMKVRFSLKTLASKITAESVIMVVKAKGCLGLIISSERSTGDVYCSVIDLGIVGETSMSSLVKVDTVVNSKSVLTMFKKCIVASYVLTRDGEGVWEKVQ